MLDLAIIGSGPAAISAAIYAARANLSVKIFESQAFGGTLNKIETIENYPGFMGKGEDLIKKMREQIDQLDIEFEYGTCESIEPLIIDGKEVKSRAVLVATGTEPNTLNFSIKPPVSYCVICDGSLYNGKNVAVVGGGNSAVQESIYLSKIVKNLTIISRSDLNAEPYIQEKLHTTKNVKILKNTEPTPELLNNFDAVFVLIGSRPATKFFPEDFLDEKGYVKAKNHQTSAQNVFVAGDIRRGCIRQAVTAAADGVAAVYEILDFLG